MKVGFWDYIRAAFNARPIGMFVPPNWIGLAAFFLLGLLNPGFWLLGAGLELFYLFTMAQHPRFQRLVQGMHLHAAHQQWQSRLAGMVVNLSDEDQRRYRALEERCQTILARQPAEAMAEADLRIQGEGLGRLLWMYLRLMLTRQAIVRILSESSVVTHERQRRQARDAASGDLDPLQERIAALEAELKKEALGVELRKSLAGQLEILQQRLKSQQEAKQKLVFLDAELTRIQEQVELIREQAVFSTEPASVSQRIDQITASLGETGQWIREQQQIYGQVEDLLSDPPMIALPQATKETA